MSELNKSKSPAKSAAPPRPSQAGVATLEPAMLPPPKPVLSGRKPEPAAAPPAPARSVSGIPAPPAQMPARPAAPANLSAASPHSPVTNSTVTIHTFEELLADLDLLAPSTETPLDTAPLSPPAPVPLASVAEDTVVAKPKPRSSRAQRIPLALPVLVRGRADTRDAFREETRTAIVFARGAMITLAARVSCGEIISLVNLTTGKQVLCEVLEVQARGTAKKQVEVEFQQPEPGFWPVSFPADEAEERPRPLQESPSRPAPQPPVPSALLPVTPAHREAVEPFARTKEEAVPPVASPITALPTAASHPAPLPPVEPAQVVDLATLILAEDLKSAALEPLPGKTTPTDIIPVPPAPSKRSAPVREVNFSAAVPSLGLRRRAGGVQAAGEPQNHRRWLVVGVAAVALAAVGISGALLVRQRSTGAQVQSAKPAAVTAQATPPSPEAPLAAPNAPQETASPQTHPITASGAGSGLGSVFITPGSATSTSKSPAKNSSGSPQTAGATAPQTHAPEKPKFTPGMLTLSVEMPTRSEAPKEEPLAPPSVGVGVPSAISSGVVSGIAPATVVSVLPPPQAPPAAGGRAEPAKVLSTVIPSYPAIARKNRVEGDVVVQAEISASGKITGIKVLSGPLPLHQAAVEALRQWKFAPGKLDGQPVSTQLSVMIKFRL